MKNEAYLHATLQIMIKKWMENAIPNGFSKLERDLYNDKGIMMPSGRFLTNDEISMNMASAAMAVLDQAYSCAGLEKE